MALTKRERWRLLYKFGHRHDDLVLYGLDDAGRTAEHGAGYLSYNAMKAHVRPALNREAARILTKNKWIFYRLLAGFDIPIPRTLGLYDSAFGISWDGERPLRDARSLLAELHRLQPKGLVIKPCGGGQAKGLVILDDIDYSSGCAVTRSGVSSTLEETVNRLNPTFDSDAPGYVLQEPVSTHADYDRLAPWTTNTVRVITIVTRTGDVEVQGAATTLGRRGNMANNWHAGGINVGVDLSTGVMGKGVLAEPLQWTTSHPDSGVTFEGMQVPHWDPVVATCKRAALLIPGTRSIGWDVVVGPDGPVLLEANERWDLKHVQVHGPGFLADSRNRALLSAAGAPLPTSGLPRSSPRRALGRARVAAHHFRQRPS